MLLLLFGPIHLEPPTTLPENGRVKNLLVIVLFIKVTLLDKSLLVVSYSNLRFAPQFYIVLPVQFQFASSATTSILQYLIIKRNHVEYFIA